MKTQVVYLAAVAGLAQRAVAQGQAYAQCGGVNFNGPTSCISGWTCTYSNPYYSQCLPGGNGNPGQGGTTTVTVTQTITSTRVSTTTQYERETVTETETVTSTEPCNTGGPDPTECPHDRKFELFGVNEAGAEFSPDVLPGVDGEDYTWPTLDSIVHFLEKGFNTVRIPVSLERITPEGLANPDSYNQQYLSGLYRTLSYVVNSGGKAIIDIHNFGRYNGEPLGEADVENFGNFWAALASWTSFNPNVGFNLMTKWHDQPDGVIFQLLMAGISAIRAQGINNPIYVEGNSWSSARDWASTNDMLQYLHDPENNLVYTMHQYLDPSGSGESEECESENVGVERVESATQWCEEKGKKCFLAEFGSGSSETCQKAVANLLCHLKSSEAWLGATWWAAGPWWGDKFLSIEPGQGPAYDAIVPVLESFL